MTPANYVDINYLRMRVKAHNLREKGYEIIEIAAALNISKRQAGYYVELTKPQLTEMGGNQSWAEEAVCTAEDTELFFPPYTGVKSQQYKEKAMRLCATCPVIEKCHQSALTNYETYGVWGGEDFSKYVYEFDHITGRINVSVRQGSGSLQKVS